MKRFVCLFALMALLVAPMTHAQEDWLWLDDPRVADEPWILGWHGYTLEQQVNNSFGQCEAEVLGYLGWHDNINDSVQALKDEADQIDTDAAGPPEHPDKSEINSDTAAARSLADDAENEGDLGRFFHGNPAKWELDAAFADKTLAETTEDPDAKAAAYNACLAHLNAVWPHIDPMKEYYVRAEDNLTLAEWALDDARTTLESQAGGGGEPGSE